MSVLGIDIGTTGCKAAAFNDEGGCLATAYREYATRHPRPGWSELDSTEVLSRLDEVNAAVAAQTARDPIEALSISAMGEAATPVDEAGRPLANCILSSDVRGGDYVARLEAELGRERFFEINPNILSASYTLPKLCWLRDHEPDLYRRTRRFLLWDGMAATALGGEPFVSYSHANRTLLFDIRREDWSDRLLDWSGVDRDTLPPCRPAGEVAGVVADRVADRLGLPRGVKIVVGGHDQCCNALGAGITRAGQAVDGMGTYECITPVFGAIPDSRRMLATGLNVEHHVVAGRYVSFLFNQAGSLVRWFRDVFAAEQARDPDIYDRLAAEMPAAPTDLFVLPCFEPTGSPGYIGDASGVIVGLRTATRRGEILKAIMESTSFYFIESLDQLRALGMDTSEFIATGGGARSDAWLQIKADIYGVPVVRAEFTECGLFGAAILAGVAIGRFESVEAAARLSRRGQVFVPDSGRHARYRERAAHFARLLPLMHPYLATLNAMSA